MTYSLSDFDYSLPTELIAQQQVSPRDSSRLLLLNKKTGRINHCIFSELVDKLQTGDLLVVNDSRVLPARLIGRKEKSGGVVEVFLHQKIKTKNGQDTWECLIGGRVHTDTCLEFTTGRNKEVVLRAQIIKNNNNGTWQVVFTAGGKNFLKIIHQIGIIPLPPYIKRIKKQLSDINNYQTVFSNMRHLGSVAAPTAGLHFTKRLLAEINARGIKIIKVTLHVGLGTFSSVKQDNLQNHRMHSEAVSISKTSIKQLLLAKKEGRRVIAVGTTSCRALESLNWSKLIKSTSFSAQSFWTDIFILPGYKFKIVNALITNFHLPKSTLLMLVSALASKQKIDRAYREALTRRYRFFSYGDAMFIY